MSKNLNEKISIEDLKDMSNKEKDELLKDVKVTKEQFISMVKENKIKGIPGPMRMMALKKVEKMSEEEFQKFVGTAFKMIPGMF